MIQKDQDMIIRLIKVVKDLKNYTDVLGQIEVVRVRLWLMDFHISELQMRPSMQVLEDRLAWLQDQYKEIAVRDGGSSNTRFDLD